MKRHSSFFQTSGPLFGSTQIVGVSDEDRYINQIDLLNVTGYGKISCFGVFDGHGGKSASATLCKKLHTNILQRFSSTLLNSSPDALSFEPILCEAIYSEFNAFDESIKSITSAGSTSVSLITIEREDGSVRVLCPWVGDSRCVSYRTLQSSTKTACSRDAPDSLQSEGLISSNTVLFAEKGVSSSVGFLNMTDADYDFIPMTEDHKPDLIREKNRIEKGLYPEILVSPIEANLDTFNQLKIHSTKHLPETKKIALPKSSDDIEIVENLRVKPTKPGVKGKISPSSITYIPSDAYSVLEEEKYYYDPGMLKRFQGSYFGRRMGPDGLNPVGPTVICSRYGVSLNMSRSVGDRYGPRSCICVPDITAITVLPDQHARFILASDGMWDVLSDDQVEAEAMSIRDAQKLSHKLSLLAWKQRLEWKVRMDDITVTVVDINPECMLINSDKYVNVTSTTCCDNTSCTIS